ncbi:hypothetical protein PybrP1_011623 [[Pythium] brassicae (nom. inval.)]|nr:hypothetical protein PybrP1_011623 [[Pythium] brassicae (nom. inval.)]
MRIGNPAGAFALPLFARRFFLHSLGLPALADQDLIDLAFNTEARREQLPQVALFSSFLRELFDGDALLFFLAVRAAAQRELGLALGSNAKRARTSSSTQYTRDGLVAVVPHPLVPDGTKQVRLSAAGCECVLRRLFVDALEARRAEPAAAVAAPSVLAQFARAETLRALFVDAATAPIESFFALVVDSFRSVSEDIVAQFKFDDDGESLTNLLRLRDTIAGDAKLASVLGRFESFIARLQRTHAVEVKASALLAKPWKTQVQELEARMAVRIQRAYRARCASRKVKARALECVRDQVRERELKLEHERMERKRMHAVRERDLQRHHARLHAQQAADEQTKALVAARESALLRKMRDEEIAQRCAARDRHQRAHAFAAWQRFVARRRQQWRARSLFVKVTFRRWTRHFAGFKRRERAAIRLQRFVRARRERAKLRRALSLRAKRSRIAKKYCAKVQLRRLNALFARWRRVAAYHATLRASVQVLLLKRAANWFAQWRRFVDQWKAARVDAAVRIQRVYRGRVARHVLRYRRLRQRSALLLQRVYRGHAGRVAVGLRRQVHQHQIAGCSALLHRISLRALHLSFGSLQQNATRERALKRLALRRRVADQLRALSGWSAFVAQQRAKRNARLRQQRDSAVLIQRTFRRHRCQTLFIAARRRHRAAVAIQRVVRGFQGRERAKKRWWKRRAATRVQTAWRQRRAKRLAETIRTEKILLGAFKGDYSATQRAIATGHGHVLDAEGNGVLHLAAAAGHRRLVKLCLRHQFDVNAVNRRRQTPLHLLLANLPAISGSDDDDDDDDDSSAQQQQEQERADKVALAAYMMDHGAWHEAPDEDGFTPLLLCAVLGQTDCVEMLLEREASTDARSLSAGLNAAQLATEGNHWRTLQVLLASRGFDFDQHASDTVRLLHACAGRGFVDSLRVLVAHIRERFDTFPAAVLDTLDDDGYTPLMYAISNGYADAVQCLLESDARPDVKDFFGRSPLHFAVALDAAAQSEAMVALLTLYEADVNVKDNDGDAPLHLSCDRDARLASTSLLLAHGAALGANALGNHPTHIAARCGALATLELLVQYGGDMNLKNYDGRTPLGMAHMYGQKLVVQHIVHAFAQEAALGGGDADPEPLDGLVPPSDGSRLSVDAPGIDGDENSGGAASSRDAVATDAAVVPRHERLGPAVMGASDWQDALAGGYWMGAIAEWTQYIDTRTDTPFYVAAERSADASDGSAPMCSWDPPTEFEAAMGEDWEIVRVRHDGGSMRRLGDLRDESGSPRARAAAAVTGAQYLYHHKLTNELRAGVPPVNFALLQDVVQSSKRQQLLRARVRKVAAADTSASAMEYVRFVRAFEAESAQTRAETHAAIRIQRHVRARRTAARLHALLHEHRSALHVQRAFRGRQARRLAHGKRRKHAAATRIQAAWRGCAARRREIQGGLRAQRETHRRRRGAAVTIQRLFRGWRGRRAWYREKVVRKLGPTGYFAWEELRRRAVAVRSFQVWDELTAPRDFPDVRFYCHQVTRVCSWAQPSAWAAQDRADVEARSQLYRWGYTQPMQRAAVRLQQLWRARMARVAFRAILRAVQLMQTCEREYLEDPTSLVKLGNYVLFLHAMQHDYARARPLYGRLMRTMAQRGPDLPFVLLSYALFLHVTREEDAALVADMVARAKALDPQLRKYQMAFLGFFRQAMVQRPRDAESNLNYAACLQWLYEQYDEAAKYYLRAIAADPHKNGTMALFQEMLDRKRQVDKLQLRQRQQQLPARATRTADGDDDDSYDGFALFRRWQAKQAEEEDRVRRDAFQAEQAKLERDAAARRLQARYRRRLAMRTTNRLQLERRMGESIAALAKQKAVYDKVVAVFDALTVGSVGAATAAKPPPLSIPVTQLSALHVNVMDMCQFVEANGVLQKAHASKRWSGVAHRELVQHVLGAVRVRSQGSLEEKAVPELRNDFASLCVRYFVEPRVQEKCCEMLKKIADLDYAVSLPGSKQSVGNQVLSHTPVPATSSSPRSSIADAEIVIRGADGKKMYFKKRRRPDEQDESGFLLITVYSPDSCRAVVLAVAFEALNLALPAPFVWDRLHEIDLTAVMQAPDELELAIPIQFRCGRVFSYRSYALLPGLVTVCVSADWSLRIVFIHATKAERLCLHLPERSLVLVEKEYRARLHDRHARSGLFHSISQKLFVEYTSRGFELVFPGMGTKGRSRRHPREIALLDECAKQAEEERARLELVLRQCIHETISIARRRNEQYISRQQELARRRRELAASSLQARMRLAVSRSKLKKECRLQLIAAAVIQRLYRRRRDQERARRAREQRRRDLFGLSFRYACRVNCTLLLLNVSVDVIDSSVGAIELVLRAWHPSAGNALPAAPLRITQPELKRIHLDVFRSAKHGLLVLSAMTR